MRIRNAVSIAVTDFAQAAGLIVRAARVSVASTVGVLRANRSEGNGRLIRDLHVSVRSAGLVRRSACAIVLIDTLLCRPFTVVYTTIAVISKSFRTECFDFVFYGTPTCTPWSVRCSRSARAIIASRFKLFLVFVARAFKILHTFNLAAVALEVTLSIAAALVARSVLV